MTSPLKELSLKLPPGVVKTTLVRLSLFLIFGASLVLAWGSVNRLQPMEKMLQAQSEKIARLEDDVLKMELKWNQREADEVAAKFRQAQELLFTGGDEVIRWQGELKNQPYQFSLDVKAMAGRTQACPLPNKVFSVIPTTLDMQASLDETATKPPYNRLLDFAQNLTTQKKRVDLVELTVNGNSNSVSQAKMGLQLWAQESRP